MSNSCTSAGISARLFGIVLCAVFCAPVSAQPADLSRQVDFNIPSQKLSAALLQFSHQAKLQVVIPEELGDRTCEGISGRHSVAEALTHLLSNSGLTFKAVNASSIAIQRVTPAESTPPPKSRKTGSNVGEESSGAEALQEVVVTAQYEFLSVDTSGTTNLPVPLEQVPQTISLVSNDFIKAADLKTLGQIAEYTAGALNIGAPEGLQTLIKLRGLPAGQAIDGINQSQSFYEPDYAIFDRLEVVQGPSSVVYGISNPGGLVNFVTKSATAQTPNYLYAQVGSWRGYRVEGQGAGALDADGHVRAIGIVVQDGGDSFSDFVYHKKTTVYGGINVDFSHSLTGYLHGGYERYERSTFDGVPTEPDGSPAPVPRSFCICAEDIGVTTTVFHAEEDLTWHATDYWDISLKGNYQRANSYGAEDYSYGLATNGDLGLSVNTYRDPIENYGVGVSTIYRLDGLGLKDSFLSLAALYQSSSANYSELYPSSNSTVNLFDGDRAISQAFNALLPQAVNPYSYTTHLAELTYSAQAWLKPIDSLTTLLGVSYTQPHYETGGDLASNGVYQSFSVGGRASYRAGLTYELLPKTFAYVSYSQSFIPQPPELSLAGGVVVAPLEGEQYEGGIKYRSSQGRLLLTGAVFELREKNLEEFAGSSTVTGATYFQNAGQVTHKGVELQALGKLTPQWQINAGYAFLDPRLTAATAAQAATVGQTELYLPRNTASLYSTYTLSNGLMRGLSFGGGVRYVGAEHTSFDNLLANEQYFQTPTPITKDIPSYTLVDLNLSYAIDKWLLQVNVHNLFNRTYFINNYQTLTYGNMPGDPFNIAFSVRRTF